ncbi:hypothetical protein CHS0354_034681, partial [Potamilus streckersoni]
RTALTMELAMETLIPAQALSAIKDLGHDINKDASKRDGRRRGRTEPIERAYYAETKSTHEIQKAPAIVETAHASPDHASVKQKQQKDETFESKAPILLKIKHHLNDRR